MPLKLTVGLSKKVGLPDYGSLGASCQLEVELDPSLALQEIAVLKERIRSLQAICRQAVQEELAQRQPCEAASGHAEAADRALEASDDTAANGAAPRVARASQRQMDYILQLARQNAAVGVAGLPRLCQHLFQKVPSELTHLEASALIDVLKDIRGGKLSVQDALPGAAA